MREHLKRMMMSVICFLSYGTWRFKTAYDIIYRGQNDSDLFNSLVREVFGSEAPDDAAPLSFVTRSDLALMTQFLDLSPGDWLRPGRPRDVDRPEVLRRDTRRGYFG